MKAGRPAISREENPRQARGRSNGAPDPRQARGRAGERIACTYLGEQGYEIIKTNYRSRYGELDIIARKGGTVVFVEVKARRDRQFGEPFEAVGARKQSQIRRMASMWLAELQSGGGTGELNELEFRFDVISILLDSGGGAAELIHLEDAFR